MTKDQETPKKMKSKSESTLNQPHIGVRFSVGLHPDAGLILGTIHILRNLFFGGGVIHSVSVYKKRWEIFTSEPTVSYDEIKQKVITQANDYHRVKAYTP